MSREQAMDALEKRWGGRRAGRATVGACALAVALALASACTEGPPAGPEQEPTLDERLRRLLEEQQGPLQIGQNSPATDVPRPIGWPEVGRMLFFDPILSGNKDVACATCHHPATALGDGLSLAIGTGGTGLGPDRRLGPGRSFVRRNTPSLLNVGIDGRALFWDGRFSDGDGTVTATIRIIVRRPGDTDTTTVTTTSSQTMVGAGLYEHAALPILDRTEMRGEPGDLDVEGNPNELALFDDEQEEEILAAVMDRLLAIPEYVELFREAFGDLPSDSLTFEYARAALGSYQSSAFWAMASPFEHYRAFDDNALTDAQKRGGIVFFGEGRCSSCHVGYHLGGRGAANVGVPQIGPGGPTEPPLDLGRGELLGSEDERFFFRIPSLWNVELTAPYMHDGAYPTLEAVVRHYNDVPTALWSYDPVRNLSPEVRGLHHGDDSVIQDILRTLDPRLVSPLGLSDAQLADLVEFLKALTGPGARDLSRLVPDHVPSGLPVGGR